MSELEEMSVEAALQHHLVFVLVRPQHPGNVGAAARAMNNMGLRRLVVVDPAPSFDLERVRWMAPGCGRVLDSMRFVSHLDDALADVHLALASTARHRRFHQPVLTPREAASALMEVAWTTQAPAAVVFGPESDGLTADDVHRCGGVLRIPTPEHASLNLAQAVLLIAAALLEDAEGRGMAPQGRTVGGRGRTRTTMELHKQSRRSTPATLDTIEPAVRELVELMHRIGFTRGTNPNKLAVSARTGLQGSRATVRHIELVRGMVRRVAWALDHPDADWTATRSRQGGDSSP